MEMDKRIMCAILLSFLIYMLFMYKQVNEIKFSVKKENDNVMKRLKNSEEHNEQLFSNIEKINNSLISSNSDKSE